MAHLFKLLQVVPSTNRQSQSLVFKAARSLYTAVNEPMFDYAPGSQEKKDLEATLEKYSGVTDCPIVIGDEEIRTDDVRYQVSPHDHQKKVASYYWATPEIINKAIANNLASRVAWEKRSQTERCDIFLHAADLISGKYRMDLLATTMLGQSKNVWQAEIDAAAELIDFLRFDVQFAQRVTDYQPLSPTADVTLNTMTYRGLEGFWAAICPFNFTAIGGHLAMAPAMMGNVALWKPSDTSVLSNYVTYKIYREAGLPAGVINFLPADGPVFGDTITASPDLVGLNFTGSVATFKHLWKQIAQNLDTYKNYPRMLGECGGKNMHFVHPSANAMSVAMGSIRSAFEFNGQKCSACSRMYIPQSMWPEVKAKMLEVTAQIKSGCPLEHDTFVTAVIDDKAFARNKSYLEHAKSSPNLTVLAGGNCDDSKGYFIEPTIIETTDPLDKIMQEEIFGPVLTVYAYPDDQVKETVEIAKATSPFALTGAFYCEDLAAKEELKETFRYSSGNMYINDKSTGSVVGQQPFGGARLSGTNDKAGGPHYMARFTSPQAIKETFVPLSEWKYPSMK